jgi:hypothetical protein
MSQVGRPGAASSVIITHAVQHRGLDPGLVMMQTLMLSMQQLGNSNCPHQGRVHLEMQTPETAALNVHAPPLCLPKAYQPPLLSVFLTRALELWVPLGTPRAVVLPAQLLLAAEVAGDADVRVVDGPTPLQ